MSEVRIEHVFKRFGDVTAVSDFDLTVRTANLFRSSALPAAAKQLRCV